MIAWCLRLVLRDNLRLVGIIFFLLIGNFRRWRFSTGGRVVKKVLLVESDIQVRENIAETVEENGVACVSCSSGLRALQFLEVNPDIDLLIVDYNIESHLKLRMFVYILSDS